MPTRTPLLDAHKAEKSAQRDKEAIQRNHLHYKDGAQAFKKDDSNTKATTSSGANSGGKQGGNSTAPLGERAAKRAVAAVAAAELASAQAGSTTLSKSRNGSAAPPVAKRSPSSPSNGKSGRGSKHQLKPSSTSPGRATSTAPSSWSPPSDFTPAPAPSHAPASSDGSENLSRPVLGLASRQFKVSLSGAGVNKGGNTRERPAERRKRRKGSPRRMAPLARRGRRRKEDDDAWARDGLAAAPQPGV